MENVDICWSDAQTGNPTLLARLFMFLQKRRASDPRKNGAAIPLAAALSMGAAPRRRVRRHGAKRVRSIWISDLHLGVHHTNAQSVLNFLQAHECEYLYLVGDIVDFWKLRGNWYWPEACNGIINRILDMAHDGVKIVYIPGNHDECLKDFVGCSFGAIEIREVTLHTTADNRRLLVLHGDQFDTLVRHNKWLAMAGTRVYDILLRVNQIFNLARRRVGLQYWSLATYLNDKVKHAVACAGSFRQAIMQEAQRQGVDGVVCGHSHIPCLGEADDMVFANAGDWVDNATAIVEDLEGNLRLEDWSAVQVKQEKTGAVHHEDRNRHRCLVAAD